MRPRLNTSDYAFYFIPDTQGGNYIFKGVRGNVFRILKDEFEGMLKLLTEVERESIQRIYGISSVSDAVTGEYTLVWGIFKDFGEMQ